MPDSAPGHSENSSCRTPVGTAGNVIPPGKTSSGGGFARTGEDQGESMGNMELSPDFWWLLGCCLWIIQGFGDSKAGGGAGCPGTMGARRIGISRDDTVAQEPGIPLSRPLPALHVLFPRLFPALLFPVPRQPRLFQKTMNYPALSTLSRAPAPAADNGPCLSRLPPEIKESPLTFAEGKGKEKRNYKIKKKPPFERAAPPPDSHSGLGYWM